MTNFIQKLFLSEQKLSILKAIEMGDIKYEQKNWTEPGRSNANRQFNRSMNMYAIKYNDFCIEISREYMEQVEADAIKGNNQIPPVIYMVRAYRGDDKTPYLQDFNSSFARNMFSKAAKAYEVQTKNKTKINAHKNSNVR